MSESGKYRRLSKDDEYLTAGREAMIDVAMIHLMVRRIEAKTLFWHALSRGESLETQDMGGFIDVAYWVRRPALELTQPTRGG